jgi:NADH-quinone oxidoreductase subunit L
VSPLTAALLVPGAPAFAAVLLAAFGRRMGERSSLVAIGALVLSLVGSVSLLLSAIAAPGHLAIHATGTWMTLGGAPVTFGLFVDGLSASILVMVAIVATMVFVYATGYMHGEERYGWFFAVFSLFTASMFGVVVSSSLLQLMVFWEVMGLCSFLLIGYWYERAEARSASFKAFITTRIGDMGFLAAVALMLGRFGTLDIPTLISRLGTAPHSFLFLVAALLFVGAVGKSAQFPLYVWLPDAMAGPTPVSGLLHSATMVAAGVFMVARMFPLFEAASLLPFIAGAGIFSAVFGATLALTETDIKRMLAYSTMSQLGYMMVALGTGGYVAAIFHLITHGFFKSLLFLSAGSVIHGSATQDIRQMGGLSKRMKVTAACFLVGALALSGIPPLAGFFSKDAILASLWGAATTTPLHGVPVFIVGLMTAILSAFYMFRVYFGVFHGPERGRAHESSPRMLVPMVVLAAITVLAGAINLPGVHLSLAALVEPQGTETFLLWLMLLSAAAAGGGVYVAWEQSRLRAALHSGKIAPPARLSRLYGGVFLRPVFAISRFLREFHVDAWLQALLVGPVVAVSEWLASIDIDGFYMALFARTPLLVAQGLARFDIVVIDRAVVAVGQAGASVAAAFGLIDRRGIDRGVDGVGQGTVALGRSLRKLQTGVVANYALFMLVLGVLAFYLALWLAR